VSETERPTAQDYADIFETDKRGARLLEDLINRFEQPVVIKGGIDAILQTYVRMGQRNIIDFISNQILRAESATGNQEETDDD